MGANMQDCGNVAEFARIWQLFGFLVERRHCGKVYQKRSNRKAAVD